MRYDRIDPLALDTDALQDATVAVVGAGATGSRMLEQLARLGADLVIVDRDVLEPSNLGTSALYTADQVADRLPKAVAAEQRLTAINSRISIDAEIADLTYHTVDDLLGTADIVLDGTDNIATRHLINEYCVKHDLPWVHVAALGTSGTVMPVVPGETACFACVFEDVDGTALATCETAGILPSAAATAASLGVTEAVELLDGSPRDGLVRFGVDDTTFRRLDTERRESCPVCQEETFPFLDGERGTDATRVCGEDLYQVNPDGGAIDLDTLAAQLGETGTVDRNDHLIRFETRDTTITVFSDGRALVEAESKEKAKTIYTEFVGT